MSLLLYCTDTYMSSYHLEHVHVFMYEWKQRTVKSLCIINDPVSVIISHYLVYYNY